MAEEKEEKSQEPKETPKEETSPQEIPQAPEESPKEEESFGMKGMGNFFSPYGLILFILAGIFDLIGFIFVILNLLAIPVDDFGILDTIAFIFVGGLMFLGSGEVTTPRKAKKPAPATKGKGPKAKVEKKVEEEVKKLGKKILKKLGLAFLVEIIPVVGNISPSWTLAVYFHLKNM